MQKNPIPESGNNTDSQGWDLIIYKDTDVTRKRWQRKRAGIKLFAKCIFYEFIR